MPRPKERLEALVAPDVEPVRVRERVRIPVGGTEQEREIIAFAHRKPVHLAVGEHAPEIRLHRRCASAEAWRHSFSLVCSEAGFPLPSRAREYGQERPRVNSLTSQTKTRT